MKINIGLCIVLLIVCTVSVAKIAAQSNSQQEIQKVDFESLASGEAQVIGKLGKPVGTVVRMLCKVEFDKSGNISKIAGDNDYLHVLEIDGVAIPKDKQPKFNLSSVNPLVNGDAVEARIKSTAPFECRGYESISTLGTPNEAAKAIPPMANIRWDYYSHLDLFSGRAVEGVIRK